MKRKVKLWDELVKSNHLDEWGDIFKEANHGGKKFYAAMNGFCGKEIDLISVNGCLIWENHMKNETEEFEEWMLEPDKHKVESILSQDNEGNWF